MLVYFLAFLLGWLFCLILRTPLVEVAEASPEPAKERVRSDRWLQRQIKYGKVSIYKVFDLDGNEIGEAYGEAAATEIFKSRYKYWDGDVSMFIQKQDTQKEWGEVLVLNDKGEVINTFEIAQARKLVEIRPGWTIKTENETLSIEDKVEENLIVSPLREVKKRII
jgi:hypothetical protein